MKITKQEIEACFPSDIIPKISLDYNIWEVKFYMEYYNFVLFIDCTSSTSNDNDVWYTARLYIRNNHNFEINYGFSNYVNTYEYILKAISLDLESYVKTGKFSKYVKGYHNMFTPEELQKLNTI